MVFGANSLISISLVEKASKYMRANFKRQSENERFVVRMHLHWSAVASFLKLFDFFREFYVLSSMHARHGFLLRKKSK